MNERQKQFCKYYAISMNATSAAIKAGYSERTAYSQGARLLKNVEIQKAIKEEIEALNSDLDLPDKAELKRFWASVMRDDKEKMSVRLAASSNLAKSLFMFNPDISLWDN